MALVFFSGGIDSSTLGADVGMHPHRYGVEVNEHTTLRLVTVGTNPPKLHRNLRPLVSWIRERAQMPVHHVVMEDGLREYEGGPLPRGGATVIDPALTGYSAEAATVPYTAGWLLWMGAVAVNVLYDDAGRTHGPGQAFVAHQFNGPVWEALDAGKLSPFDSSPAAIEALNGAMRATGERVIFRAPFLENRMSRGQVVELALEIGLPLDLTSSCMYGWMKRCGACCQCLIRQAAFKNLGVKAT